MNCSKKSYLLLTFFFLISCNIYSQNWNVLAEGIKDAWQVHTTFYDSTTDILYVGGVYNSIGGITAYAIANWKDGTWDTVGGGVDNTVQTITKYNNQIYIGGGFNYANHLFPWTGGTKVNGIAKWNGSKWEALGSGDSIGVSVNGLVLNFYQNNGDLYVLGNFDSAGGMPTKGIAKWDGQQWSIPYPPINTYDAFPFISCAAFYKNEFYVGGNFPSNQGFTDIQKWNGNAWTKVGDGFQGGLSGVFDMKVYKGYLYVAGSFLKDGGVNPGNCIVRWDGSKWEDIGGVLNNDGTNWWNIDRLLVFHDKLYVSGYFTQAGDIPASCLASFDGNRWCAVTDIFNVPLGKMGIYRDSLFVFTGKVAVINGDTLNGFALYTGNDNFDTCGENMISGIPVIHSKEEIIIFPNPSKGSFVLNLPTAPGPATLRIFDALGRLVLEQNYSKAPGSTLSINLPSASPGLYLVKWNTVNHSYFGKVMLE